MIIISPNLGETGAPQLGHLRDTAPEGPMTWRREGLDAAGAVAVMAAPEVVIVAPHLRQNAASSGSWEPHLVQYTVNLSEPLSVAPELI
jgi:hypothetical protein